MINPALAADQISFDADVARWCQTFQENGGQAARLPGARAAAAEARAMEEGLRLPENTCVQLRALGQELSIPLPG